MAATSVFSRRQMLSYLLAGSASTVTAPLWLNSAIAAADLAPLPQPLLLHFNENSLGMSPLASKAARQVLESSANRYPGAMLSSLVNSLAIKHKLVPEQVILGNGSSEILRATTLFCASQGATLVQPTPTFGYVADVAKAANMPTVNVPVDDRFQVTLSEMQQAVDALNGPALIYLSNPNNPTASLLDAAKLAEWIRHAPQQHTFLIDEAYHEYAQQSPDYHSMLPFVLQGRTNVIVARTFSKIYAMAGLRVGYGMTHPKLAKVLNQFAASGFNVNNVGLAAAIASLQDNGFLQFSLQSNQTAKRILTDALDGLELAYIPSSANFVLHRISGSLADYQQRMADMNIRVGRRMTEQDGWCRLSVGTEQEMQQFVSVLKQFRERGWV